jgi:hypothetical protein
LHRRRCHGLSRVKLARQKPFEAEILARRAFAIRDQRHPDHWTRYDALSLVGAALAGQKKYTEAEPLLIEGCEGLKELERRIPFVWRKKRSAEAGARIVARYDAWGKPDKATKWRAKLGLADLPANVFSQWAEEPPSPVWRETSRLIHDYGNPGGAP